MSARRWTVSQTSTRRAWVGEGGAVPDGAERLLAQAKGHTCQWDRAGRAAGAGIDQVDAERLLWALVDAGLVTIQERRTRAGDWEPYRWSLTPAGEALGKSDVDAPDIAGYLAAADGLEDPDLVHPVLQSIRQAFETALISAPSRYNPMALRLAMAIGQELRKGRMPRGRLLAVDVGGHTKAVRVADHRAELEVILGCPLEEVVRLQGRAVYLFGPLRFYIGPHQIHGTWSRPWLALTPETIAEWKGLEVQADRLLTIENLTAFEEEVRAGLPEGTIALYTGGFPGSLERQVMQALVDAGIRHVDHWGDLDLGGLRILRHLQTLLPVPVRPFRMDPALLEQLPTQPLTERDRIGLVQWLQDPEAPCHTLAQTMLERDQKAEQEGWFLRHCSEGGPLE